jgi:hypothetical protein
MGLKSAMLTPSPAMLLEPMLMLSLVTERYHLEY